MINGQLSLFFQDANLSENFKNNLMVPLHLMIFMAWRFWIQHIELCNKFSWFYFKKKFTWLALYWNHKAACQSKWLVAAAYVFAGLWKHDVEIMWVFLGAAVSYQLSLFLKRVLNHERPTDLRSDPGMPSSHAQSLCYAATFLVLSCKNFRNTPAF